MKRRKFFQYAGWGSVGLVAGARTQVLALPSTQLTSNGLELKLFDFQVPTVDSKGQLKASQWHQAKFFPESLDEQVNLDMVAIAPGHFKMGTTRSERDRKAQDYPQRSITVQPFFMSKYPITQSQWASVSRLPKVRRDLEPAPSHFNGVNHPVESISWLEAVEFCDRLSNHTGRRYQLPSEAQWEYACRAGTQTPFHTGETITSSLANYVGTYPYQTEAKGLYRQTTVPVGSFSPNAFGLYDMHGNVWEWCSDRYAGNAQIRSIRGGSWLDKPANMRSASRSGYAATSLNRIIGFRVSCAEIA
ncbi:formylglycine-generating enzyme family protein [Oculatella sp. LEGE 06141]|uniref:formylglycine-generating enzyme family protein n=1 Tax=Oculatella sp. LEGE 06141 TaxID=1828648 RepID=UPI001882BE5C|nr:formylglycine-generating enzyme family protein [Oculatella sp. LEGE 06141]MBE9182958.1 formylglycine-generating enzyme family protein [Oculatella sp. LEGE 06141]